MATFQSTVKDLNNTSVIELSGDLDAHTSVQLEQTIQGLLDKNRINLVVNFQKLNYISSAGLGVFMSFIDDIRARGGDIKFTNMSEKIYQVFDLLGFPLLYEFYDEEKKAVAKFQ
jgi:anti-sigma B factor antagonist